MVLPFIRSAPNGNNFFPKLLYHFQTVNKYCHEIPIQINSSCRTLIVFPVCFRVISSSFVLIFGATLSHSWRCPASIPLPSERTQWSLPAHTDALLRAGARLLHSLSLVAVVPSEGLRHGLQLAGITFLWFVVLNIDYRLLRVPIHCGLTWPMEISTVFQSPFTVPCAALTAGKCLSLKLCKENVKQFIISLAPAPPLGGVVGD